MTASLLPTAATATPVPAGSGLAGSFALRPLPGGRDQPLQPSPAPIQPEGLLQVHTAPFRGSFGGVFSQALRSAGLGSRVLISQFLKGGVDQGPERAPRLCGRLQWLRPAVASCLTEPAATTEPAIGEAVREVWLYSRDQLIAAAVDLLVLDELGLAIELGYLPAAEVIATLEQRPSHLDVILTGPSIPADLLAMADQVTQLRRGG
jgi:cob(I)alamin adenosyltransferase